MKIIFTLLLCTCYMAFVQAQSQFGINTDTPKASSVLEIVSTDKGVLIPRLSTTQRTSIASPDTGLMVYDSTAQDFYYYNGSAWVRSVSAVNDYTASGNQVSIVPLWQAGSNFTMSNNTGADLSNCESGFEPTIYEASGNVEVKLVIRITSTTAGTNNFQLRAHDGTTQSFPILNTDSWTYAATQAGFVAVSEWKDFAAGVNIHELHLFGWVNSGSTNFNSAYLMVRPNR